MSSWRGTVVVLGAGSPIARHAAAALAKRGHALILAGRDAEELPLLAADLRVRSGVKTSVLAFDALEFGGHEAFLERCREVSGDGIEGVLLAFGLLGDEALAERDFGEARRILDTNFTAAVSILHVFAAHLESKGSGFLIAISSVAGDRGRQSNYVYGAAKAGLSAFLQGLRNRLFHKGVRVLTVKPGFVDTAMTFGRPGMFLVASPERAGRAIVEALERGKDVVYVPGFWRPLLLVIRAVPERVFKRLRL